MISVSCSCGRRFKAEDQHAGKRTRCPACGNLLIIAPPPPTSTSLPASPSPSPSPSTGPAGVTDNGEVPSWWFPTAGAARPGSQSRSSGSGSGSGGSGSRSNSNPDDVQTVVMSARSGASSTQPPGPWWTRTGPLLGLTGGMLTAALLILSATLWMLRPAPPGPGPAPAPGPAPGPTPPVTAPPPPPTPTPTPRSDLSQAPSPAPPAAPGPPAGTAPKGASTPAATATASTRTAAPTTTPRLQVLVPAYFYPGGDGLRSWSRLMDAASRVKITAIMNPDSGPGGRPNPDYDRVIQAARNRGVRVIGYVNTEYAKRSWKDVTDDIDRWVEFYPQIDGIFFDQQSAASADVDYYLKAGQHARAKIRNAFIATNPGTICHEAYFAKGVADVICVYAGFEGFDQFNPPANFKPYSSSLFAALPYKIPDAKAMRQVLRDAVIKRIGFIFVSDTVPGGKTWAELPAYWEEEVNDISQVN